MTELKSTNRKLAQSEAKENANGTKGNLIFFHLYTYVVLTM